MKSKIALCALAVASTFALSGCGGRPSSISASLNCSGGSGGVSCDGSITLSWHLRAIDYGFRSVTPIDASDFAMDMSSSNTPLTATSGTVLVTVKVVGGTTYSQSFAWTRSGSLLVASNPTAVSSWLNTYWATAKEVRLNFLDIGLTQVVGGNMVVTEATYDGEVEAGTVRSWYSPPGGGGCPDIAYCQIQ